MWVVEKGPIAAPEYLAFVPQCGKAGLTAVWVVDEFNAARFEDEDAALAAATETGVDALRITEIEDEQ